FTWQRFPCVLKAGHCHGGKATAKLDNPGALQDAAGLLCGAGLSDNGSYCSLEPYIDAKFDVHIQKVGSSYKAFMRKSISGNWKTNQGSAMLEQIPMTEKYKTWVDEVSELFGGMEVCGVAVIVSKEGKEFIISAADSTFPLMGDSQEEDRRQIADLVVGRMQNVCRPSMLTKAVSRSSISSRGTSPTEDAPPVPIGTRPVPVGGGPPPIPERTTPGVGSIGRHGSISSQSGGDFPEQPSERAPALTSVGRRDSQASQSSSVSGVSSASAARSAGAGGPGGKGAAGGGGAGASTGGGPSVVEDAEDTMKNLRKTFAGIFGDIVLSTRESSIDSVIARPASASIDPAPLCNGSPGQAYGAGGGGGVPTPAGPVIGATSSVHSSRVNVSSLDGQSGSSGATAAAAATVESQPKRPSYDPTLSERINPFDKDKLVSGRPAGPSAGTATSSKITSNDDHDRYTIQQGIREQPSLTGGRFQAPSAGAGSLDGPSVPSVGSPSIIASTTTTSSSSSSTVSATTATTTTTFHFPISAPVSSFSGGASVVASSAATSGYSSAASVSGQSTPATSATSEHKKQEFGRTKRASSDAEIIFGDRASGGAGAGGSDLYSSRFGRSGSRGEFRQRTESLSDAELIFGTSAVTGPPVSLSQQASPAPTSATSRFGSYSGSRDSASFSSTTSDSEFIYGRKEPASSVLTKSMSVASGSPSGAGQRPWARGIPREDDEEYDLK
uniref:Synapsin ATP-binding domain-containing protein n=1 Tax=Anopheles albimanus TaxID=7167 RepID=A0A182FAX0_ANOAL